MNNNHESNLSGGHLLPRRLHDEPEPVAGDGADAEGRHEDGEVLRCLQELAQQLCGKKEGGCCLFIVRDFFSSTAVIYKFICLKNTVN